MIAAVIMAGGRGERFWPLSRESSPKQCLKLVSDKPMIVEAVERLRLLFGKEIYIATGEHLHSKIKKLVSDVNYVIEPMAKNTAACIGLSALKIMEKDKDAIMFVETSDHIYKDDNEYLEYVQEALKQAEKNKIVLIGVMPFFPNIGFGYIKQGNLVNDRKVNTFKVDSFKEKPDLETAKKYVESGVYLWNSGMFIAKCSVMLEAIKKHMPELYDGLMRIKEGGNIKEEFEKLSSISIDYGVMEKEKDLIMVRFETFWYDVGDWSAMDLVKEKDKDGNVVEGEFVGVESTNNVIMSKKLVATLGVNDLAIVETDDAVLVCPKERAAELKKLVEKLDKKYTK